MNISVIGDHLLISLLGWILGITIGGSLGYGGALITRHILTASRKPWKPIILLPWRTIVMALPLLSPFVPVWIGLGTIAGIFMDGLFVFVLAFLFTITTVLNYWFSPSLNTRILAGTRSLAVASPVMAVSAYWIGGGGLGGLIWQIVQQRFDYQALLAVLLLAFLFDIAIGLIQMLTSQPSNLKLKAPVE
jgi:hypothetical protein